MHHTKNKTLFKLISLTVLVAFFTTSILPPRYGYAQLMQGLNLPAPGAMVLPSHAYVPTRLMGMTIHPDNPLQFDFIIDSGNGGFSDDEIRSESERLVKYFLASLTVPKDDLWVNLSPVESDRIVPDHLGKTVLGRDMLEQDYLLKQLTASLIHPDTELGKKFWERVRKLTFERFGTTDIPMKSFNKVWVLPEAAQVYEYQNTVYITHARLKVMTDFDYTAMRATKDEGRQTTDAVSSFVHRPSSIGTPAQADLESEILREIIIPEIEREVNEGQNFAPLRQIYHSLILAKWYKETIKDSLLSQVYVDQNKVVGVNVDDETIKQQIYDRYIEAYKKGVFNLIKEDYDALSQDVIPRKYFSGGIKGDVDIRHDQAMVNDRSVGHRFVVQMEVAPQHAAPVDQAMLSREEAERLIKEKLVAKHHHLITAEHIEQVMARGRDFTVIYSLGEEAFGIRIFHMAFNPLQGLKDPQIFEVFAQIIERRYDTRALEGKYHLGQSPETLTYQGRKLTAKEFSREMARFLLDHTDENPYDVAGLFRQTFLKDGPPPEVRELFDAYMKIKPEVFDLEVIRDLIPEEGAIADIGAGENILGQKILEYSDSNGLRVSQVVGTDIIDWREELHSKDKRLEFVYQYSPVKFPLPSNSYDTIILKWVLHHVSFEDQLAFIKEIKRILKPGGKLIIFEALGADEHNEEIWSDYEKGLDNEEIWGPEGNWQEANLKLNEDFRKLSDDQQKKLHALEDYFGHNVVMNRVWMPQPFAYRSAVEIQQLTEEAGFDENKVLRRVYASAPLIRMGPPSARYVFEKRATPVTREIGADEAMIGNIWERIGAKLLGLSLIFSPWIAAYISVIMFSPLGRDFDTKGFTFPDVFSKDFWFLGGMLGLFAYYLFVPTMWAGIEMVLGWNYPKKEKVKKGPDAGSARTDSAMVNDEAMVAVIDPTQQGRLDEALRSATGVIGSVTKRDKNGRPVKAPVLIDHDDLDRLKGRAIVFTDISTDQGGNIKQPRHPFSHAQPAILDEFGHLHEAVPNMPAAMGSMASPYLASATQPYLKQILQWIKTGSFEPGHDEVKNGISIINGRLVDAGAAEAHEIEPLAPQPIIDDDLKEAWRLLSIYLQPITIGIPKEIKNGEKRVGITVKEVEDLRSEGVRVLIEQGVGEGSGIVDAQYEAAGAEIRTQQEVWHMAHIIKKVKEPLKEEFELIRQGQIIFTYLHLANEHNKELIAHLMEKKVTAIAYEAVTVDGRTPLLDPMSHIAGWVSALRYALYYRPDANYSKDVGADNVLTPERVREIQSKLKVVTDFFAKGDNFDKLRNHALDIPDALLKKVGIKRNDLGHVVILGGGQAGFEAAYMLGLLGTDVTVSETNQDRRRFLEEKLAVSNGMARAARRSAKDKAMLGKYIIAVISFLGGGFGVRYFQRKITENTTEGMLARLERTSARKTKLAILKKLELRRKDAAYITNYFIVKAVQFKDIIKEIEEALILLGADKDRLLLMYYRLIGTLDQHQDAGLVIEAVNGLNRMGMDGRKFLNDRHNTLVYDRKREHTPEQRIALDRQIASVRAALQFINLESQPGRDNAMTSNPGGIDMNDINVSRKGEGAKVHFDPKGFQPLLDMPIDGFAPVIINVIPITSVLPLLGLEPKREEELMVSRQEKSDV